jgi:PAS domain S-box-containing protein
LGADLVAIDQLDRYKGWWVDTGKPIALDDWGLVRAIRHGETSVGQLVRIQCFDGSFKTILASAAPLYDNGGTLTGAVAINEDVTALQEGEQRWRQRERLLNTMFELLPVGVCAMDASGKVTLVNPAVDRICGQHDWKGLDDFSALKGWHAASGERVAPEEWAIVRALREGVAQREELIRIEAADDSQRTIINWAAPILGESGEITGAIAVNEDVSPLYRTQEQLRAVVRDREEILAIVAHDLRNPLSSIMLGASTAQAMAGKLPGGEKLRDRLAALVDLAGNMAGLVEDLLAIGVSTNGGKPMLDLQQVAPSTLLNQAFDRAHPLYAQGGVELRREIEPGLPDVYADPRRIERVLANLLDNALKYTEPASVVTLGAKALGPVVFSVANSGPAMSAEQREAMFQPFWQADHGHRGAGLGLSICRSIVEAHGGTIWAEPAEGQRVRVSFHVPRVPAALVSPPAASATDVLHRQDPDRQEHVALTHGRP